MKCPDRSQKTNSVTKSVDYEADIRELDESHFNGGSAGSGMSGAGMADALSMVADAMMSIADALEATEGEEGAVSADERGETKERKCHRPVPVEQCAQELDVVSLSEEEQIFLKEGVEIERLHAAGAINSTDSRGLTALQRAVKRGSLALVELLLSAGADPNKATSHAMSPVNLALLSGDVSIAETLIRHGAKIDQRSLQGAGNLGLEVATKIGCETRDIKSSCPQKNAKPKPCSLS